MVYPKWRKSDENGHAAAKRRRLLAALRCAYPADCELI